MPSNLKKIASAGFNANDIAQNSNIVPSINNLNAGSKLSKLKSVANVPNLPSGGKLVDAAKSKGIGLQGMAAQTGLSSGFGGAGSLKSSLQDALPDIGGSLPDVGGLADTLKSGFANSIKIPKL